MSFISQFVKEQKRYTKNELRELFSFTENEVETFLRQLRAYGIVKTVRATSQERDLSDLIEEDLIVADETASSGECFYVFTYVGILTSHKRVIKCYPKYLQSISDPTSELKQVLKVLQRYGSKEQIVTLYHGTDRGTGFNLLAVMLYLLDDFHQYGAYTNDEDIVEKNGEGPILWERTISNGFAIISNNRPYYIDYYTSRTIDDEYDFFHRLHLCVVSSCSKQLQSAGIMELFDMIPVDVSEEKIDDFGETEYILYRIQSELNVQFNTRKQTLLKTLYAFIANARTLETNDGISMYGTPSFNLVWEQVCSEVFQNKLKTQLRHLHLPGGVRPPFRQMDTLLDLIEKPKWAGISNSGTSFVKESNDTLTPDLIGLQEIDGDMAFIILDAKYYCIQLSENAMLRGQPGVGDVTKQYLYQLAYKGFLDAHNITNVKNCFLMPVETDEVEKVGEAYMSMLDNLGLQRIQIRLLPAKKMFDQYLRRRPLGLDILCL